MARSGDPDPGPGAPPGGSAEHDDGGPSDTSELVEEIHALRSAIDGFEKRRKRMAMIMLVVFVILIPLGILGAHLAIDYESGRVADAIERSSGPFTDEALARACRAIKIPLFGPETKKRLHCPSSSETETTTTTNPEPTTTAPPSPAP
jgi:hypothetical protein